MMKIDKLSLPLQIWFVCCDVKLVFVEKCDIYVINNEHACFVSVDTARGYPNWQHLLWQYNVSSNLGISQWR